MKSNNVFPMYLYALLCVFLTTTSCQKEESIQSDIEVNNPTISCEIRDICSITVSLTDINVSGVTFKGEAYVAILGIECGILYSTSDDISYNKSSKAVVKDIYDGQYKVVINNLEQNTKYYYTAYIRYNDTNQYGKTMFFTTPSFTTPLIKDITESTVRIQYEPPKLSNGETVFSTVKIEISTSEYFTFDTFKSLHLSSEETECVIKQLSPNTSYYVRAVGLSSSNETTSEIVHFKTSEADLSGAADLSTNGTANCYVISKPGIYCFDAVAGNSDRKVSGERITVLWENISIEKFSEECSIIKWAYIENGKVYFEALSQDGNALLFLEGDDKWSWHIWKGSFEDEEYSNGAVFMNTNLGEINATRRLAYQWGRKEPFPIYADLYGSSYSGYYPQKESSNRWSINEAISMPMTFFELTSDNAEDWLNGSDCWQTEKSIYDPCPVGYIVPPSGAWEGCTASDFSSYYRTLGYYTYGTKANDPWILNNSDNSYFWTSMRRSESSKPLMLLLTEDSGFWETSHNPSVGTVVRCMREGHGPRHMNENLSFTVELSKINDTEAQIIVKKNGTETDTWYAFISTTANIDVATLDEFRSGSASDAEWKPYSLNEAAVTFFNLQPDTEYYCHVIGCTDYKKTYSNPVSLKIKTYNRDYAAWLGDWTFTGENGITFDITFVADIPNESYYMYGWEGFGKDYYIKVNWHNHRKHWVIMPQTIGTYSFGERGNGELFIGGVNYYTSTCYRSEDRPLMNGWSSGDRYYAMINSFGKGYDVKCSECKDAENQDRIDTMNYLVYFTEEDVINAYSGLDDFPSGEIVANPESNLTKSISKQSSNILNKSSNVFNYDFMIELIEQ
ncbi:MAG: hypothetical protein J6S01_10015 [Bacteroidales bacterium]|nr:hypothetical protein [Bacteroidales bacterium]